jgi:hypothetical protein
LTKPCARQTLGRQGGCVNRESVQNGQFSQSDALPGVLKAASDVDRILRGAKPGDLAVPFSTKFEMAVNLKTVKALGLAVPYRFFCAPTRSSITAGYVGLWH